MVLAISTNDKGRMRGFLKTSAKHRFHGDREKSLSINSDTSEYTGGFEV
ncbi:MAG: hypothetical protein OSB05_06770 [Akkermansiaceae bacterium]|nr:hypothetical protein [Akkermansiaceae bacterium]